MESYTGIPSRSRSSSNERTGRFAKRLSIRSTTPPRLPEPRGPIQTPFDDPGYTPNVGNTEGKRFGVGLEEEPEQEFVSESSAEDSLLQVGDQQAYLVNLDKSISKISGEYTSFLDELKKFKPKLEEYIIDNQRRVPIESTIDTSGGTVSKKKKSYAKSRGYRSKYKNFKGGAPGPNERILAGRQNGHYMIYLTNNLINIGLFCVAAGMTEAGFKFLEDYMGIASIMDGSKDFIIALFNLIITFVTRSTNMILLTPGALVNGFNAISSGLATLINMAVNSISNMGYMTYVTTFLLGAFTTSASAETALRPLAHGLVTSVDTARRLTTLMTNFYIDLSTRATTANAFFGTIITGIRGITRATINMPPLIIYYTKEYWFGLLNQFYDTLAINRDRDVVIYNKMAMFGNEWGHVATGGILLINTAQVTYIRSIDTFNAAYNAARTYIEYLDIQRSNQAGRRVELLDSLREALALARDNLVNARRLLHAKYDQNPLLPRNLEEDTDIRISEYIFRLYEYIVTINTGNVASRAADLSPELAESKRVNDAVIRFCIFAETNRPYTLDLMTNYSSNFKDLIDSLTPDPYGNIVINKHTIPAPLLIPPGSFPYRVPVAAPPGAAADPGGAAAADPGGAAPFGGGSRRRRKTRRNKRRRTRRFR